MSYTFLDLAKERYSVRKFTGQQIEQEKLDKILEAGNVAPTAVNYQPQRIYVLQSEESLAKVRSLCPCIYDAPTVLLIAYDDNQDWDNPKQPGIHSGEQDVSIVATHMMLEAWSLGVASCWVNLFPNNELEQAFDLPANEKTVLLCHLAMPPMMQSRWRSGISVIRRLKRPSLLCNCNVYRGSYGSE